MNALLAKLHNKQWLWRGIKQQQQYRQAISTSYPQLDAKLGGGFPTQGVIECKTVTGIGELRLMAAYLKAQQKRGLVVFVNPPSLLNGAFLVHAGLDLQKILCVDSHTGVNGLWGAEQSLKSGCCAAVIIWQSHLSIQQVRRLSLAAEQGHSALILYRDNVKAGFSLPVALSLSCHADIAGIKVAIDKQKGGRPCQPFLVDMSSQWPDLVLPQLPNNVVALDDARIQRVS
ncbi:translesion DNA synthesis-associated protein ImuA [Thalassotalea agarivorans]|uniref:RecA DNA recombination protein n=1 Tax=Thalassotalea agarivorans TaxID=349064 RepID=A0A1I0GVS7_THASX|nr:translesion DNA synthesis-associated protein ImuA [Thalassotalea agarivorans]SET74396.1 recA DNA recombination protein [Thalassotalea agarivorans]